MRKIHDHLKTLEELDVEVVAFRHSGKHFVLRCRSPRGDTFSTTIAKTPSDHRAFQNWRSAVRRAATHVYGGAQ